MTGEIYVASVHNCIFSIINLFCLNLAAVLRQIWQNKGVFVVVIVCKKSVETSQEPLLQFFSPASWLKEKFKKKQNKSFPHSRDVRTIQTFVDLFSQSDDRIQGSPVKTSVKLKLQKEQHETRSGIFCELMRFLPNFKWKSFNL